MTKIQIIKEPIKKSEVVERGGMTRHTTSSGFANIIAIVIALVVLAGAGAGYWIAKNKTVIQQELKYENKRYGFSLTFPESWKNYVVEVREQNWRVDARMEEAIVFGFPEQRDLFIIYPFSLAKIERLKINKLNPINSLGPVDYTGENNQYAFYRQTAQDVVSDAMIKKLGEVGSIFSTFKTSQVEDETAGWKIYTNTTWGYSISYPQDYVIFTAIKEKDAGLVAPIEGSANVTIAKNDNKIFCCEPETISIASGVNENMSLQQWLDKQEAKPTSGEIVSVKNIKISGYDAIEIIGSGNLGSPFKLFGIDVNTRSLFFEITQSAQDAVLEEILSTFKFTSDGTTDWKTYRDEEGGFEFKYPSMWEVTKEESPFSDQKLFFRVVNPAYPGKPDTDIPREQFFVISYDTSCKGTARKLGEGTVFDTGWEIGFGFAQYRDLCVKTDNWPIKFSSVLVDPASKPLFEEIVTTIKLLR